MILLLFNVLVLLVLLVVAAAYANFCNNKLYLRPNHCQIIDT